MTVFLNRNLLPRRCGFGLTTVETDRCDVAAALQRRRTADDRHARPAECRADTDATTPPALRAAAEPAASTTTQPSAQPAEQPERKHHARKQRQHHRRRSAPPKRDTSPEKPALETALAQIEIVRGDFRNAIAGLNKLGELLKQAQRESKTSDKEIQSVRQTLRSLQSVRI